MDDTFDMNEMDLPEPFEERGAAATLPAFELPPPDTSTNAT